MDSISLGSSVHGILQARILEVGCHSLLQGIFLTQGIKPRFPALQVDSLLSEPTREARSFITSFLFHLLTQVPSLFLNLDISWHYPSPVPRGFLPQLSGLKKFVCKRCLSPQRILKSDTRKACIFFHLYICMYRAWHSACRKEGSLNGNE